MGDLVFLQMCESIKEKISNFYDFCLTESLAIRGPTRNKILQVHLRTLHHNIRILSFRVLINLQHGNKVPIVLDHILTNLTNFLHIRDLLKKTLILIITFYFDLLNCVQLVIYHGDVHVGVTPTDLVHHFYVLQAVVALNETVMSKEI